MFEITPLFEDKGKGPLYIQLSDYFKHAISTGDIASGEKLPSKRKLAAYLGLSINTVQAAYEQLMAEGYLKSSPRKGLFAVQLDEKFDLKPDTPINEKKLEVGNLKIEIDFSSGKIDLENFPYATWRKLTLESIYEDQGDLFYTGDSQGELVLRQEMVKYLFESRGVRCSADQIIIGAGTQILIGLLCLMIGKDHSFAIEDPGYHRTREVLKDHLVRIHSIPLDEYGIDIECLKNSKAKVAYVTPSHQFPYGMVMPISRRMELLKWAEENQGYIIEDDYDGEFRYKGKPIPSLQGLDHKGRVVYLGTFSKSLIPSIRMSYLVLPKPLIKSYHGSYSRYKQTTSRLHQDTLFRFMNQGHWQRHLNKMRTLYRKKQTILLSSIEKYMGNKVNIIGERSGLHILLEVNNGMSEEELIKKAYNSGIKVYPVSIYYHQVGGEGKPLILLGFGSLSFAKIEEGIRRLTKCWDIHC